MNQRDVFRVIWREVKFFVKNVSLGLSVVFGGLVCFLLACMSIASVHNWWYGIPPQGIIHMPVWLAIPVFALVIAGAGWCLYTMGDN